MKNLKVASIITLMLIIFGTFMIPAQKTIVKRKTPVLITAKMRMLIRRTNSIIGKMDKHLPRTLNVCKLAKWTMKDPKPAEDPGQGGIGSLWNTTYDGMRVEIYSSVSPGYEGQIIARIKLTIPARNGYLRKRVSDWVYARYGNNTRVGSTMYSPEYMTNCWLRFSIRDKMVIIEMKWMG